MRRASTLSSSLLTLVLGWSCSSPAGEPPAPTTGAILFEGARLIVGDGSVFENAAFLVEGNRFGQVGRVGEIESPNGAERVDLAGKTVMPALIDGHGHLGYTNARNGTRTWENYTRENLIESMQRAAYYGIATHVSMGNDGNHGDLPWTLQEEDIPNGARWMTVGGGISTAGGGQGGVRENSWAHVTTEKEARQAVRDLVPHNPVYVKIWVDDRAGTVEAMPEPLYRAVIDEAHQHNIRVIAHTSRLEHSKGLLRAGADGFAHMVRDREYEVDDEFIELAKQNPDLFVTPILPPPGDGDPGYTAEDLPWIGETHPPSQIQPMRERLENPDPAPPRYTRGAESYGIQARNLVKLKEAGVLIGMGTDSGAGWTSHTELADMVLAGMTPSEVITAATKNMSIVLQIDDIGSVAEGNVADFIVLDANPLDDINNTRRISQVYLRGKEVDRAAVSAKLTSELPGTD